MATPADCRPTESADQEPGTKLPQRANYLMRLTYSPLLTRQQVYDSVVATIKGADDSCTVDLNFVVKYDSSSQGMSYLHVNSFEVYNLLIGNKADGSEHCEYLPNQFYEASPSPSPSPSMSGSAIAMAEDETRTPEQLQLLLTEEAAAALAYKRELDEYKRSEFLRAHIRVQNPALLKFSPIELTAEQLKTMAELLREEMREHGDIGEVDEAQLAKTIEISVDACSLAPPDRAMNKTSPHVLTVHAAKEDTVEVTRELIRTIFAAYNTVSTETVYYNRVTEKSETLPLVAEVFSTFRGEHGIVKNRTFHVYFHPRTTDAQFAHTMRQAFTLHGRVFRTKYGSLKDWTVAGWDNNIPRHHLIKRSDKSKTKKIVPETQRPAPVAAAAEVAEEEVDPNNVFTVVKRGKKSQSTKATEPAVRQVGLMATRKVGQK